MLSNVSEQSAWIGNLSLFSLVEPIAIVQGEAQIGFSIIISVLIALLMYIGGIMIFNKRSLPL